MFGAIFDFFMKWLIICLTGVVIKLMDDYLDQELDKIEGKHTLAVILDRAIVPYTLLFMVLCMSVHPMLAGSLFLASYIIGMGHNLQQALPLGWSSLQESIIFGIFGLIVFGFTEMISSLLIIIFVQLVDDCFDYYTDKQFSRRNFVIRFGLWETILICLITFIAALIIDWQKSLLVSISLPLILFSLEHGKRFMEND